MPPAGDFPQVHATLRLTSGATQYRQGELISLDVQFTSNGPERFVATVDVRNRWDILVPADDFQVTPAQGAVDPLASYETFFENDRRFSMRPAVFTFPGQMPLPVTIHRPLTDWLRFDQPGHYKVFLRTLRVSEASEAPSKPSRAFALDTNPVEFDIVPADPAWQDQELKEIASQTPLDWTRLRALSNADAARFLAQQYRGDLQPLDHEALLGLFGSPHKQAGIDEMNRLLRDPDFPVTPSFLNALARARACIAASLITFTGRANALSKSKPTQPRPKLCGSAIGRLRRMGPG
jgi:hypothetical protein